MPRNRAFPVAAAAALVVVLLGCQSAVSTSPSAPAATLPRAQTTPTPTPTAAATPSLDPGDTSAWLPFVSERYGFSLRYPPGWEAHVASGPWTFPQDTAWPDGVEHGDWFYLDGPDGSAAASAWWVQLPAGTTADQWFDAYCTIEITPCEPGDATSPLTLDGHPGWFVAGSDPQAYFGIGDRIYLIVIWQPAAHPALARYGGGKQLVEAIVSTMELLPQ